MVTTAAADKDIVSEVCMCSIECILISYSHKLTAFCCYIKAVRSRSEVLFITNYSNQTTKVPVSYALLLLTV